MCFLQEKKEKKEEVAPATDEKKAKKEKKEKRKLEEAAEEPAKKAKEEPAAPTPTPAAEGENTRVYVGNLPFSMTDDWMKEVFQSAGEVREISWLTHADTGKFKGAGFLTFAT